MLTQELSKLTRFSSLLKTASRCFSVSQTRGANVTLLGANKPDSNLLALLLKQNPHIKSLKLYDPKKDLEGVAMDLSHIDTPAKVTSFTGFDKIAPSMQHSDIVIFNHFEKTDTVDNPYLERIEYDIEQTVQQMLHLDKTPIVVVMGEPVDIITPIVGVNMHREKFFDPKKLLGCVTKYTTVANKMHANYYGVKPELINYHLYHGVKEGSMYLYREGDFPTHHTLSAETEGGIIEEQVEQFFKRNDELNHLSAYSAYKLVSGLVTSFQRKRLVMETAFVYNEKIYLSVPCVLGKEGVEQLVINHDLESVKFFKKLDEHIGNLELNSESTRLLSPVPAYK